VTKPQETVITAELNEQKPSMLTDPKNKELLKRKQAEWEEKIEPLLEQCARPSVWTNLTTPFELTPKPDSARCPQKKRR